MPAFRGAIFDVDGVLVDSPHEPTTGLSLTVLSVGDGLLAGSTRCNAGPVSPHGGSTGEVILKKIQEQLLLF